MGRDLIFSGGAQIEANPLNSIRSGSKGTHSGFALAVPLTKGVVVQDISFEYRYNCGYGKAGVGLGTNFSVSAAGSEVYASPHFTDYAYDENRTNFSVPVPVKRSGLSILIPTDGDKHLEFGFDNNDRNLELLLPLRIDMTCTGGPCADFPVVPTFIDSNMVLQRAPLRARIWGRHAEPSETVVAKMDGDDSKSWHSTVAADGVWVLELDPQEASDKHLIELSFSISSRKKVLTNVAFGDVYLCSGQSNMEFSVNNAFNASQEIADSSNYPGIRMFTAARAIAEVPQFDVGDKTGGVADYANSTWAVSGPGAFSPVGGTGFSWFSAACYFFGRDVYQSLNGEVPIGLVASNWGGQPIEVFSSPDALSDATCGGTVGDFQGTLEHASKIDTVEAPLGVEVGVGVGNGELWNGMISPFAPMRFAGAVWYQGENNVGYPHQYSCLFPAMIADWRSKFELPDMSFFFVQLAAYVKTNYASIRNAQMAALKLPKVGYAVAIDIGDAHSPVNPIHPRRKQEVGRRLALSAQKIQYGQNVVSTGPEFASLVTSAAPDHFKIIFAEGTAETLHFMPTADCDQAGSKLCCDESPFEVLLQGGTGQWVRVNFTISGKEAVLQLPANATSHARYAWEAFPLCSLYNGVGGPDDHTGIAATPWCFGDKKCGY